LYCIQALLGEQSVLTMHSGLQPSYGFPKYPGKQLHEPALFCSLHWAFAPHGDGVQGCGSSLITTASEIHDYRSNILTNKLLYFMKNTLLNHTLNHWISSITMYAVTHRRMADNTT